MTDTQREWINKLYFGDNLRILRDHIPDESVDLIYLDPPFNSQATYNVLFQEKNGTASSAQITAFEDTWHWGAEAESTYHEIVTECPKRLADVIQALRAFLGQNDMMAYLVMMAIRLAELHRVLKPAGSIFLHCDPTASHYLKLVMDAVFDQKNFRNEIVWKRSHAHSSANRFGAIHDVILFFAKTSRVRWNTVYQEYDSEYIEKHYRHVDADGRRYKHENPTGAGTRRGLTGLPWRGIDPTSKGRHWVVPPEELDKLDAEGRIYWSKKAGAWPYIKVYLDEKRGVPAQDVWTDIDVINMMAKERLGYPTQKPEALLDRIISASSNEGDLVLDPFCGCGTTINVAERLHRRWIGIDITHLAIALMKHRLNDTFGSEVSPYELLGDPKDLAGAKALAEHDRYQFQWWALSLVEARPAQEKKKGADTGIDGYIYFFDDDSGKAKKILVQVKSGKVSVNQIRDLIGTVDREKAAIGVFVSLEPATGPMMKEALAAGYYVPTNAQGYPSQERKVPRIQLLTIEELLDGARVAFPRVLVSTFKRARRVEKPGKQQTSLLEPRPRKK